MIQTVELINLNIVQFLYKKRNVVLASEAEDCGLKSRLILLCFSKFMCEFKFIIYYAFYGKGKLRDETGTAYEVIR